MDKAAEQPKDECLQISERLRPIRLCLPWPLPCLPRATDYLQYRCFPEILILKEAFDEQLVSHEVEGARVAMLVVRVETNGDQ